MRVIKYLGDMYKGLPLIRKFLISFVVLVFIPTLLLSVNFIQNIYETSYNEQMIQQSKVLDDSLFILKKNIETIESLEHTFQSNNSLLEFMSGYYPTPEEQVYVYNKDIYNTFKTTELTYDIIRDIKIYTKNPQQITIAPYVYPFEEMMFKEELDQLKVRESKWVIHLEGQQVELHNYAKMYTYNFSRATGYMRINVALERLLQTIDSDLYDYMIIDDSTKSLYFDGNDVIDRDSIELGSLEGNYLGAEVHLDNGPIVISAYKEIDYMLPKKNLIIGSLLIFALLLVLLAFNYMVYKTFILRINHLKKHLSVTRNDNLIPIPHIGYMDEIGYAMLSFNHMTKKINRLINEVYKAEIKEKESMYYALQTQIKPHFLYNTLESIRMLAEDNCDFVVADSLYALGHMLRYTINDSTEAKLGDELDYVKEYINLYQYRMKTNIKLEIKVPKDMRELQCPRNMIQPLVENAIVHGFKDKKGTMNIQIMGEILEKDYKITIKDNGLGITEERARQVNDRLNLEEKNYEGESIGLANVHQRLKHYYGPDSGLYIEPVKKGTATNIILTK